MFLGLMNSIDRMLNLNKDYMCRLLLEMSPTDLIWVAMNPQLDLIWVDMKYRLDLTWDETNQSNKT